MSNAGRETGEEQTRPDEPELDGDDRWREQLDSVAVRAKSASKDHISIAVPFRAAARNRRVAASVLAGGVAYRLFLWLIPFGFMVVGVLGLGNADAIEEAVSEGGLPPAVVDAIGDSAGTADSNALLLLLFGVWLLLWAGYTGAKALQLIHALVWNEPPRRANPLKSSLVFNATCLAFMAVIGLTWWIRDETDLDQLLTAALMVVPLAALWLWVSLLLPHGHATWRALLPGALFTAVGFQVLHGSVVYFLGDNVETSTSLYGVIGIVTTVLFFMYLVGRIVVISPVLNSSLHDELRAQKAEPDGPPEESLASSNGQDDGVPRSLAP